MLAVIAIVVVGGGIALLSRSGPKYTRSECIVKLRIQHISGSNVTESENHLFDKMSEYGFQQGIPVASYSYGNPNRSHVYVVYGDACDQKFDFTRALASWYMKQFPERARLTVSEDVIEPGRDTVEFGGPHWIDGTAERRAKLLKQRGGQQ